MDPLLQLVCSLATLEASWWDPDLQLPWGQEGRTGAECCPSLGLPLLSKTQRPREPPFVFPAGSGSNPTVSSHCDGPDRALWGRQLALLERLKQ